MDWYSVKHGGQKIKYNEFLTKALEKWEKYPVTFLDNVNK